MFSREKKIYNLLSFLLGDARVSEPYKIDWIYLDCISGKKVDVAALDQYHTQSFDWMICSRIFHTCNRHTKKNEEKYTVHWKKLIIFFSLFFCCSKAQKTTVNDTRNSNIFVYLLCFIYCDMFILTFNRFHFNENSIFFSILRCFGHFDTLHAFYSFSILHIIIINMWNWVKKRKMSIQQH